MWLQFIVTTAKAIPSPYLASGRHGCSLPPFPGWVPFHKLFSILETFKPPSEMCHLPSHLSPSSNDGADVREGGGAQELGSDRSKIKTQIHIPFWVQSYFHLWHLGATWSFLLAKVSLYLPSRKYHLSEKIFNKKENWDSLDVTIFIGLEVLFC